MRIIYLFILDDASMLQVGLSEYIVFAFYLVISSLIMLNMLIGVIRDVVGKVAADNRDDGEAANSLCLTSRMSQIKSDRCIH